MTEPEPKRFTTKKKPKKFYIDDEAFFAAPSIPVGTMMDMSDLKERLRSNIGADPKTQWEEIRSIFKLVLLEESFDRFDKRLYSADEPIDYEELLDILQWLFGEAYARVPTQSPPSLSSTLSTETGGESSTDGASADPSTHSSLLGIGSLT